MTNHEKAELDRWLTAEPVEEPEPDDGEQFMTPPNRGETRRQLEQATAEAVLLLLDQFEAPLTGAAYERLAFCLEQWRKARGM